MKGRTNITDGIFLNATTEQKTVKSGETIVAGDFVNYSTTPSVLDLGSLTFDAKVRIIGENRALIRFDDSLCLVELDGTNTNIITTYPSSIVDFDATIDGKIVILYRGTTSAIRSYKIENDDFVFLNAITFTNGADSYVYIVGNYAISFGYNPYGSGKPTYSCNASFDVDNKLTKIAESTDSSSATISYRSNDLYKSLIPVGNVLCQIVITSSSSSYYYKLAKIYPTGQSHNLSISDYIDAPSNYNTHLHVLAEADDSHAYIYGDDGIYYMKIGDLSFVKYPYHDYDKVSSSALLIDTNTFIFKKNNYFSIAQIADTYTEPISNIYLDERVYASGTVGVLFAQNGFLYVITQENLAQTHPIRIHVLSYDETSYSEISGIVDINEVERWKNTLKPLGVAKDSGTGGDTISVYIPSSQY